MRRRKWILVLAVTIATIASAWFVTLRVTRLNDRIKQILLERVRPFLAQESDIEKVELGLHSLHLKGVKLAPKDRSFSMEIEDVRLGYRFWNLIKYRFKPHKLAHEVVLIRPSLVINTQISRIREVSDNNEAWLDPNQLVDELEAVKRVTVVDAAVFIQDSARGRVRLAHTMNGWLDAVPVDSAFLRLTGNILENKSNNLMVEGKLNLLTGRPVGMGIRFSESEPVSELPFLLPDYVQVTSGKIRGEVEFYQNKPSSGFLEITQGEFTFKEANLVFEDVTVRGVLQGSDMVLNGGVGSFNGSQLTISGKILDLTSPRLDLSIRCSRFDIPVFFQRFIPEARLSLLGDARFDFHYTGALSNPSMRGRFESPNLRAYGVDFNHFGASIALRDSLLTLKGEGVQDQGLTLVMEGEMDFYDSLHTASLAIDVGGSLLPTFSPWARRKIRVCGGKMSIRMWGELKDLQGEARGTLSCDDGGGDVLTVAPHFIYDNRNLRVDIQSNNGFTLSGDLLSPFHGDSHWDVRGEGLASLLMPWVGDRFDTWIEKFNITGTSSGSAEKWELRFEGFEKRQPAAPRVFDWTIQSGEDGEGEGDIEIRANYYGADREVLPLFARVGVSGEGIDLRRCEIGDMISLRGTYPFRLDERVQGNIAFSGFYLEKFHALFPGMRPYSGEFQGGIARSGTKEIPKLDVDVRLRNGRFHSVGIIDANVEYRWDAGRIQFAEVSLRKDGASLFSGRAEGVEGDSVVGSFSGKGINVGDVVLAATGKRSVEGLGNIELHVKGGVDNTVFHGSLQVDEGMLGPVNFRELRMEVVDTLSNRLDFFGDKLTVQNGLLERDDGLQVRFWGTLPQGQRSVADVTIQAKGNILGFLPEVSGFFKSAQGSGDVFLRWAGGPEEWVLGSGHMRLDNGRVELGSFVEGVENLQGQIELIPEERFIKIVRLTGEVDGEAFVMTNTPVDEEFNGMTPIVVGGAGADLGALQLITSGKGIRAHLPGFMEQGEIGWLGFGGLEPGEAFVFAGPAASPLFQGNLYLTDHRLTYPFLSIEKDAGTSQVLKFLQKVNWDIRIIPSEDVHYVRDIESPLGNVYVDLLLRNNYGEIRMDGIIQEDDLQVWGNLVSTEGSIEVLNHLFRPERITFDYPRGTKGPIISGRAFTTLHDSLGMPSTVWLALTESNGIPGFEREGGPWGKVHFRFYTDNPNLGRTEADLMAALGYSAENIRERAYDALGVQVDNLVFRPLIRPLERGIRRHLGLDLVRVSSMFSRNLAELRTMNRVSFDPKLLLRSTKLTLGKYVAPGLFVIYSGQIQQGIEWRYHTHGLGFRHALSLEYTIRPDLFLQMEYTYDSQLLSDRREDKRIWLRHVFPF